MSKKTTLEKDVGASDAPVESPPKEKKPSTAGVKIVSVILLAGMLLGFFVPFYISFTDGFKVVTDSSILGGQNSIFGYLSDTFTDFFAGTPKFTTFWRLIYYNKYLIGIGLADVLLVITTLITLFKGKSAPGWFRFNCLICFTVLAAYGGMLYANGTAALDIVLITCIIATLAIIVQTIANVKKKSIVPLFCFILLVAALVVTVEFSFFGDETMFCFSAVGYFFEIAKNLVLSFTSKSTTFAFPVADPYQVVSYIAFALLVLNTIMTAFQMGVLRTNGFTIVRYLLQVGVTAAAIVMTILAVGTGDLIPFIIFAACILVAFILCIIDRCTHRTHPKKSAAERDLEDEYLSQEEEKEMDAAAEPVAEEPAEEPVEEAPAEEPAADEPAEEPAQEAEPVADEPTEEPVTEEPVEETEPAAEKAASVVLVADTKEEEKEEPAPAPAPAPAPQIFITINMNGGVPTVTAEGAECTVVETETDEFLRGLSKENKAEFKKLFMGDNAPDYLPAYQPDKDNTRFFNMVFVHLGKIRPNISDELLKDIYDFMQTKKSK